METPIFCPFCGNTVPIEFAIELFISIYYTLTNKKIEQTFYYSSCSCGARGPQCYSREEAIQKWNRRTGEQNEVRNYSHRNHNVTRTD